MDNKPEKQFNSILDFICSQPNERNAIKQLTKLRDLCIGENAEFIEIFAFRRKENGGSPFSDAMSITVIPDDGEEYLHIYNRDQDIFRARGTDLLNKSRNGYSIGLQRLGVQTDDSASYIEYLTEILGGISSFMDLFEIEHLTFKEEVFGGWGPLKKVIIYVDKSGVRKVFQEPEPDDEP